MKKLYKLSHFFKFFSHRLLQKFGFLPRWIVFSIDVALLFLACIVTFFIINTLSFDNSYSIKELALKTGLMTSVSSVFFLVFKTYSGLIRHSTIIDIARLLVASGSSFTTLVTINLICMFSEGSYLFRLPTLLIYTLSSFSLLMFFRILVKRTYDFIYTFNYKSVQRLAIVGISDNSIALGSAIISEKPKRFNLITFLDFNKKNRSKRILNTPITYFDINDGYELKRFNIDAVLLPNKLPSGVDRSELLNRLVEKGFRVYEAPQVEDVNEEKPISSQIKNIQIEDLLERKPIELDTQSIKNQIKRNTIFVTGAAGSIGSEIAYQVAQYKPYELVLIDQAETPMFELGNKLKEKFPNLRMKCVLADIRNYGRMEEIFAAYQPKIVYHAAAYKHVPLMEMNPAESVATNVFGTKNLADLSIKYLVDKFVMVSTDKAVNPSNVMGASKRIAEIYVQCLNLHSALHHTRFITTRFGNVLGSNGSVVPIFKEQIAKGGPLTVTHPDIIRYFMTIREACQLVLEAGAMGNGGEIFIFDMGQPVKIMDLAIKMIRLSGLEPFKDIDIKFTGLRPGEKLYEELLNNTATTHPTYNEKITIASDTHISFEEVMAHINDLQKLVANKTDLIKIVAKMKQIVPEFKSQNSVYQSLDAPGQI